MLLPSYYFTFPDTISNIYIRCDELKINRQISIEFDYKCLKSLINRHNVKISNDSYSFIFNYLFERDRENTSIINDLLTRVQRLENTGNCSGDGDDSGGV